MPHLEAKFLCLCINKRPKFVSYAITYLKHIWTLTRADSGERALDTRREVAQPSANIIWSVWESGDKQNAGSAGIPGHISAASITLGNQAGLALAPNVCACVCLNLGK